MAQCRDLPSVVARVLVNTYGEGVWSTGMREHPDIFTEEVVRQVTVKHPQFDTDKAFIEAGNVDLISSWR
jgi:hypothetical protein